MSRTDFSTKWRDYLRIQKDSLDELYGLVCKRSKDVHEEATELFSIIEDEFIKFGSETIPSLSPEGKRLCHLEIDSLLTSVEHQLRYGLDLWISRKSLISMFQPSVIPPVEPVSLQALLPFLFANSPFDEEIIIEKVYESRPILTVGNSRN